MFCECPSCSSDSPERPLSPTPSEVPSPLPSGVAPGPSCPTASGLAWHLPWVSRASSSSGGAACRSRPVTPREPTPLWAWPPQTAPESHILGGRGDGTGDPGHGFPNASQSWRLKSQLQVRVPPGRRGVGVAPSWLFQLLVAAWPPPLCVRPKPPSSPSGRQ